MKSPRSRSFGHSACPLAPDTKQQMTPAGFRSWTPVSNTASNTASKCFPQGARSRCSKRVPTGLS